MSSRVPFRIQRAGERDVPKIRAIFDVRREWLHDVIESDQWASVAEWRTLITYLIRRGNVWVLVTNDDAEKVVGTVTLDRDPDFDFWSEQQRAEPAFYLSKLATARSHSGLGLGQLMLDWAVDRAARLDVPRVRLDTWKTSEELQAYYAQRGWTKLGVVDVDHRQSGALFERRAEHLTDWLAPFVVEWEERGIRDVVNATTLPMPLPDLLCERELYV